MNRDRVGETKVGQIITVDFARRRVVVGSEQYEAAIDRLERAATREPDETARSLRRLAESFRARAQT